MVRQAHALLFVNKRISWGVLSVERFVIGFQVERKTTVETLRSAPLYRRFSLAQRSLGLRPRLRHYAPPWSVNGRGAPSRVVASVHAGRTIVLDNCTQNADADWIDQFKNSKYNGPELFGDVPGSTRYKHEKRIDSLGSIRMRDGEVIKIGSGFKDLKTESKSSSSSLLQR